MNLKLYFATHKWVMLLQFTLLVIALFSYVSLISKGDKVYIACVFDGNQTTNSDKLELLHIYEEIINNKTGLSDKELEFKSYFYNGNQNDGKKLLSQIINEYDFATVFLDIKQDIDESSLKIYEEKKIPIIMTNINKDINNSALFQMLPSTRNYGKYMAFYSNYILNKKSVHIIHSESYNENLVSSFIKVFNKLDNNIANNIVIDNNIEEIVNTFKVDENLTNSIIVMDGDNKDIVPLIVALKRANISIPILLNKADIGNKFNSYKEEKNHKGYFTENIISPAIISLDYMNKNKAVIVKEYSDKVDTEISYPLMNLIYSLSYIIDYSLPKDIINIEQLREDILVNLHNDLFFDKNQQAIMGILKMVKYEKQHILTMPIDPILVIESSISKEDRKNIMTINKVNKVYPTDIVHTGISIKKISNINMDKMTYTMDFFLWFVYQDGVKDAENIEFLNTKASPTLLNLVATKDKNKSMSAELIKTVLYAKKRYSLYHVKGDFFTKGISNYALGKQNLEISFRNHKKNLYELSYAYDFLNTNNGLFSLEDTTNTKYKHLIDGLKFDVIDDPSLELNYYYAYFEYSYKSEFGNPEEIAQSNQFGKFTTRYHIQHVFLSVRGIQAWINTLLPGNDNEIKISAMIMSISIAFIILIISIYAKRENLNRSVSTYWWLLQLIIIFFILLFIEFSISQALYNIKYSDWGQSHQDTMSNLMLFFTYSIAILWWLLPAYYITSAFEQFLWEPMRIKTGAPVPNVLIIFVTTGVYLLTLSGIMAFVFELTTTSLAATSGFIAIMLGVASKIDLSNIIAGLGISFSKIFIIGDWVKIGDVEGEVVEMTTKATKIKTVSFSIINIPNTTVSSSTIENFTRPTGIFRLMIRLETIADYRFEDVEKVILDAIYSTEGILQEPQPAVLFHGQGDSSQIYETVFFINDYSKKAILKEKTWRRIWRHLEIANITLATPQREIFMPKVIEENNSLSLQILKKSTFFDKFSEDEKKDMSKDLESISYSKSDVIDMSRDNLYIVGEGVVVKKDSTHNTIRHYGASQVFYITNETLAHTFICERDSKLFILKQDKLQ